MPWKRTVRPAADELCGIKHNAGCRSSVCCFLSKSLEACSSCAGRQFLGCCSLQLPALAILFPWQPQRCFSIFFPWQAGGRGRLQLLPPACSASGWSQKGAPGEAGCGCCSWAQQWWWHPCAGTAHGARRVPAQDQLRAVPSACRGQPQLSGAVGAD